MMEWATSARKALQKNKSLIPGVIITGVIVFLALFGSFLVPHEPNKQKLSYSLIPPYGTEGSVQGHLLGTDVFGRDVLSRIISGARTSLMVAVPSAVLALIFGTCLGLYSGYFGGAIGSLIAGLIDIQLAFPLILLVLVVVALIGSSMSNLVVVMTLTSWPAYARLIRANTMKIKQAEFIMAAHSIGAGTNRILFRHVLVNIISPVIVTFTFDVARLILMEASLSFLGLGVPPPKPSWGRMMYEARDYLSVAYWLALYPGVALMATVVGINLLGDGLRDLFDPRTHHR